MIDAGARLRRKPPRTGVVVAPNWLGDAIMCLPAIAALRTLYPNCAWTVLARAPVAPVFRLAELCLRVEVISARPWPQLPRCPADVVIVLPNSFHAAVLSLRLRARQRIGYARDRRGWLLNPALNAPEPGTIPGHESFYYLELLRRAGILTALPAESSADLRVPLHPDPASIARWRQRLRPGAAPVIALHVGATFGTAKRWMPERFAELAAAFAGRGFSVVLVGSQAERELARKVRMLAALPFQIKNLAGETTLPELAALLASVDLVVANDSGPMHLAGAVGTPVVAIFGSTNERETYPLTETGKLQLVKAPGIECSPCKLRECPIDHRCMTRVSVKMVLEAALAALEENPVHRHEVSHLTH